jgi:ferredoxin
MCTAIAPGVFTLNDDRQSEPVNPAGETEAKILEAAENCPVSAILVEDAETGERLFPVTRARPSGPTARSPR